jgi:hypothetical protein
MREQFGDDEEPNQRSQERPDELPGQRRSTRRQVIPQSAAAADRRLAGVVVPELPENLALANAP